MVLVVSLHFIFFTRFQYTHGIPRRRECCSVLSFLDTCLLRSREATYQVALEEACSLVVVCLEQPSSLSSLHCQLNSEPSGCLPCVHWRDLGRLGGVCNSQNTPQWFSNRSNKFIFFLFVCLGCDFSCHDGDVGPLGSSTGKGSSDDVLRCRL